MFTLGRALVFAGTICILLCFLNVRGAADAQTLQGVNLAGAAFSPNALPGHYGYDFIYPNDGELTYFTAHGMNVFRLSVLWERLQPALNGPLDPAELARLTNFIADAQSHGASVVIDIHNYGFYRGVLIGQGDVSSAEFADLWARLGQQFGGDDHVLFGLMNEPKQPQPADWAAIVQQAVLAIRATGAQNQILLPGIDWDSAQGFADISGASLGGIADSKGRLVFEVHEYFDADSSGTSDRCIDPDAAVARLAPFTRWLRSGRHQGFLGEFGVSRRPECLAVLDRVTAYLKSNADVWLGWTYWAAGPIWGDYMFTLEPKGGVDRPQMKILEKYLKITRAPLDDGRTAPIDNPTYHVAGPAEPGCFTCNP
jgi:endoglucanase